MSQKVLRCKIQREQGYLYYINREGNVARQRYEHDRRIEELVLGCELSREDGYLLFLDRDGDVSKSRHYKTMYKKTRQLHKSDLHDFQPSDD